MKKTNLLLLSVVTIVAGCAGAGHHVAKDQGPVDDQVIAHQNAMLAKNTAGQGAGPQSPRDLAMPAGNNPRVFATAPSATAMNLCNIHFHKYAEHKGGEFTVYAGNGDGHGYNTGYRYSGRLTPEELRPVDVPLCPSKHGGVAPGDTIEVHYVYSSAQVKPGVTLAACIDKAIANPQLRVETQVYVLVNDSNAQDFVRLAAHGLRNGYHQALNIPADTGTPVSYAGSTTGPNFNEMASPFQVSWSVRPKVVKVNALSVGTWCKGNTFDEDHAHGVRNLVVNPDLLSRMVP